MKLIRKTLTFTPCGILTCVQRGYIVMDAQELSGLEAFLTLSADGDFQSVFL